MPIEGEIPNPNNFILIGKKKAGRNSAGLKIVLAARKHTPV
jgi:hypothetical protein